MPQAWIRHRRLERRRAELAAPRLLTRPVQAVGARWGLRNPIVRRRPARWRIAFSLPDMTVCHRGPNPLTRRHSASGAAGASCHPSTA